MEQFIGCDAHKKFSVFVAVNEKGQAGEALRVAHDRQLYREFLERLPAHSAIAVEASGSYSWLVDEMEWSGHRPTLSLLILASSRRKHAPMQKFTKPNAATGRRPDLGGTMKSFDMIRSCTPPFSAPRS